MSNESVISLLNNSISIINNDPLQFELLLQLSNNKIYKKKLSQESAKNTNFWVKFFNENQLSFINQPYEIRSNKKINLYINIDILLWKEYILNNPLEYFKLPYKAKKNFIIIKTASKDKTLWYNYIKNTNDYIKAPLLIKEIPEIVINNIKCINTFNKFYKIIPKKLKNNEDILLKIITIDPNSIKLIINNNLLYKELLYNNNFLISAIKININIIDYLSYKSNDQTFITLILDYLIKENNEIYIKQIINYLLINNNELFKIINNDLLLYNKNIINNELIINDELDITKIISNNLVIFNYLPDKLKLSIPFLYNLIKKNHKILYNICNYLSQITVSKILYYPYYLKKIKPVHTFDYMYNKQIKYLLFNSVSINPLVYEIIPDFTKKYKLSFKMVNMIIYKNPKYLLSNRKTDLIVNDFKKKIISEKFDNTLYIWEKYGFDKLKIDCAHIINELKHSIINYKNSIINKDSSTKSFKQDLTNWSILDCINNLISFSIHDLNNDIIEFKFINKKTKVEITSWLHNYNYNTIINNVNNLILTKNKLYFILNIIENLLISNKMIHFLLATHKGFILPSSNNNNKISLCPELLKIICNYINIDNNMTHILINSGYINQNFPYIENIKN